MKNPTPNWTAFEAQGRPIFDVARDSSRARSGVAMTYHYSLQPGIIAEENPSCVFDVRDLPDWTEGSNHWLVICEAILDDVVTAVTGDKITLQ